MEFDQDARVSTITLEEMPMYESQYLHSYPMNDRTHGVSMSGR